LTVGDGNLWSQQSTFNGNYRLWQSDHAIYGPHFWFDPTSQRQWDMDAYLAGTAQQFDNKMAE